MKRAKKKGTGISRPLSEPDLNNKPLEPVIQLKLNTPRRRLQICQLSEVYSVDVLISTVEGRIVEEVRRSHAELYGMLVVNGERFLHSEIEVEPG